VNGGEASNFNGPAITYTKTSHRRKNKRRRWLEHEFRLLSNKFVYGRRVDNIGTQGGRFYYYSDLQGGRYVRRRFTTYISLYWIEISKSALDMMYPY
jgi:hypothetical protein